MGVSMTLLGFNFAGWNNPQKGLTKNRQRGFFLFSAKTPGGLLPTPPVIDQPALLVPLLGRGVLASLNKHGLAHPVRFPIRESLDQNRQHLVGGCPLSRDMVSMTVAITPGPLALGAADFFGFDLVAVLVSCGRQPATSGRASGDSTRD
jgi:hypothetical protein